MLALRLAFTTAVMALVVWLLLAGRVGEELFVVVLAVWLQRTAETGRIAALAGRIARP
jgi:hypothetical protein